MRNVVADGLWLDLKGLRHLYDRGAVDLAAVHFRKGKAFDGALDLQLCLAEIQDRLSYLAVNHLGKGWILLTSGLQRT